MSKPESSFSGQLAGRHILLVLPEQQFSVQQSPEQQAPSQQKDPFVSELIQHQVNLHHCPVMQISSLEGESQVAQIKSCILDFARYDRVIIISRTAARLALDWLDRYWIMGPQGLPIGMRFYAVGKSTGAVLKEWSIDAELPAQAFNSEGLLALPSLQNIDGEQVLIFCGEGGRPLLSEELSRRGATVTRCELYRRHLLDEHAQEINRLLLQNVLDLVVVHSGELLNCLLDLVEVPQREALCLLPLLVPSDRIKDLAEQAGFQSVICAGSALPEDMVSALRGWYSGTR